MHLLFSSSNCYTLLRIYRYSKVLWPPRVGFANDYDQIHAAGAWDLDTYRYTNQLRSRVRPLMSSTQAGDGRNLGCPEPTSLMKACAEGNE